MIAGVEEAAMTLLQMLADDAPAADLAEAADRVAAKGPGGAGPGIADQIRHGRQQTP